jgi:enamine deaminase RidA (YjgF/YER057c/UK114 family)
MSAQLAQAMDNLETVLREAGTELSDVVVLNVYTTDVDRATSRQPELRRTPGASRMPTG